MATERIDVIVSEKGSRVVRRNLEDIGGAAQRSAGGVEFLKRALATIGIAAAVREFVRSVEVFNNLQNRLRSVGLEGQNLAGVYRELFQVANQTRSSVEGSVELYARLSLSSKELGVSQRDLIGFTKSLNQAILLSGASGAEAQAGLIQLSQGMASGTLRGDELRSVLEQLPAVADVISQHLGVTRGQLRQLGQEGKITAKDILEAFKEAAPELEQRFGKTVPTISQSFQVLKNQVVDLAGQFNAATGFTAGFSAVLGFLGNNLATIAKLLVSVAAGFVLIGGGAAAITAIVNAVRLLTAVIAANPMGALLIALTSVITALTLFRDQIKLGVDETTTLGDLMRAIWEQLTPIVTAVAGTIEQIFINFGLWSGETYKKLTGDADNFGKSSESTWLRMVRAVARAVDAVLGLFMGLFRAVSIIFNALRDAVSNNIEQIVNAAKAAKDLDLEGLKRAFSANLDGWKEAGKKVGGALAEGLDYGFGAIQAGGFEAHLDAAITRAKEIGAERVKAQAQQTGTVSSAAGKPTTPPVPVDEKAMRRLAEALKNLIGQYDGVYAAQQQLIDAEKLLQQGVDKGLISAERKAQVLELMKVQLRDQLDPLGAVNRELDKEQSLLKLTAEAREVETQFRAIELDLQRQGITMSTAEVEALKQRLKLIQDETKAAEARNAVLQAIKGPQQETLLQIKAIQDAIKAGSITEAEANAYFVAQHADVMAGTVEARAADLFNLQQYYAQVDQWRQADLISAQTAAKLKADAETEYNLKRLDGASKFFGTLAGLSRSENRKLAAIGKAAAVAQATIDGFAAVQAALKGPPGPPWSYGIAAATAAVTGANVAAIINQPLPGFAFGGTMKVPGVGGTDSQTVAFRGTPGETIRVSTPAQDREEARREQQAGGQAAQGGVRIINVLDPALVGDYLATPEGERVLVNMMRRNRGELKG